MTRPIVSDTSAIYALVSTVDDFHQVASTTYTHLVDERVELFITSYILLEAYALIQRRLGFATLATFVSGMQESMNVVWIDSDMHQETWNAIASRDGRGLSFVDWSTIVVARRLDAEIFTFDSDFLREGIRVIP